MDIAPLKVNDYLGDAKLLDHIARKKPDMLAFSVYPWNIERTLFIARKVKALAGCKIPIVFGGPEIHPHNPLLAAGVGADYLISGEGEIPFVELGRRALLDGGGMEEIKSAAFWAGASYRWNLEIGQTLDLRKLPSPYLQQLLPLKGRTAMTLFSFRGCYFQCSYCQWQTMRRVRPFAQAQVLAELKLALASKLPILYLSDAALNLSPHFKEICNCLAEAKPYNKSVRCFVHLGSLSEGQARMLGESGISGVEVGLQSIDPQVNLGINRHFDQEKFEHGVNLLKKYNVRCLVDIIIGLPLADRSSIVRTIDYVRKLGLNFSLFHLSVSSGCRLYQDRELCQLELQPRSPYYVVSTSSLAPGEISELYREFRDNSADLDPCLDIGYPGTALRFFDDDQAFAELKMVDGTIESGISDWVIRAEAPEPPAIDFGHWLRQSASKLAIWLLLDRLTPSWMLFLEGLIACLADEEYHTIVNIYLQVDDFTVRAVSRLGQLQQRLGRWNVFLTNRDRFVAAKDGILRNDGGHICLLAPKSTMIGSQAKSLPIPSLQLISLAKEEDIAEAFADQSLPSGYWIDFPADINFQHLLDFLLTLDEQFSHRQLYFRHPVIHRLYLQKIRHICADPMHRHMLLFKDRETRIFDYNDYDLALEAILRFDLADISRAEEQVEYFAEKVQARLNIKEGKPCISIKP